MQAILLTLRRLLKDAKELSKIHYSPQAAKSRAVENSFDCILYCFSCTNGFPRKHTTVEGKKKPTYLLVILCEFFYYIHIYAFSNPHAVHRSGSVMSWLQSSNSRTLTETLIVAKVHSSLSYVYCVYIFLVKCCLAF